MILTGRRPDAYDLWPGPDRTAVPSIAAERTGMPNVNPRDHDPMTALPQAPARWAGTLTVIRVFLGITFATYGLVKVLGGQYNYGDWVIDKSTVDGTSLVWAF